MNEHFILKILKALYQLCKTLIDGLGLKNAAARVTFAMEVLLAFLVIVVILCLILVSKDPLIYFLSSLPVITLSIVFVFLLERRAK